MKRPIAPRARCAALLLAVAALPGLAQEPYYDPVRDVMVTPTRPISPSPYSYPATTPSRTPAQQPYYDPVRDVMVSPAPAVSPSPYPATQLSRAASEEPYYDPVQDVIVTPVRSHSPYLAPPLGRDPIQTFDLVVRGGQLIDGPSSITVDHGTLVSFVIDSDVADSLRLDGYDLGVQLIAGQPVLLKFTAEQPGRFTYRLARSGRAIGVMEVGPPRPKAG